MTALRLLRTAGVLLLAALLSACPAEEDDEELVAGRGVTLQEETPLHPGPRPGQRLVQVENPFDGDPNARMEGRRLWEWYNCAGCHGQRGGGGIAPPLIDGTTIYGSDPASIYQSIFQGRPNGMPGFGGMLPEQQIWKLVTYVQGILEGDVPPERMERDVRIAEWEEGMLDARWLGPEVDREERHQ